MNRSPQKRREIASAATAQTLLGMLGCFAVLTLAAFAADPNWWSSPGTGSEPAVMSSQVVTNDGVVTTNYMPNPYAAVAQGQLKQFTVRAVDEMNARLPGGAGTNLNALVQGWSQDYATNSYDSTNNIYAPYKPSDLAAMSVGQLKTIANLVYGRLSAAGYTNLAPSWLPQNTNSDNVVAVIGQLKEVFNFDLSLPGASDLTAVSGTSGTVNLNWTLPASNNVTTWYVEQQNADGTWSVIASVNNPNATSYTVTGLTNGQAYTFQVFGAGANNVSTPVTALGIPSSLPPAATPTASPAAGTYTVQQPVTLTSATPGATIYYTTDGTAPNPNTSLSVASGQSVMVAQSSTLQALAVASGDSASPALSQSYSITGQVVGLAYGQTITLRSDSSVWSWGSFDLDYGGGSTYGSLVPELISGPGQNALAALPLPSGVYVTAVAEGDGNGSNFFGHSLALASDGSVWAWATFYYNQAAPEQIQGTGTGNGNVQIKAISCSTSDILLLDTSGRVWQSRWSGSTYGSPVMGGPLIQITGNGNGFGNYPIESISEGLYHTLALDSHGQVWAWGDNFFGEIGNGTTNPAIYPVHLATLDNQGITTISAGDYQSVALSTAGQVWAWGLNSDYEVGDGTQINRTVPEKLTTISGITAVSAGGYHVLALKGSTGQVYSWGYNAYGDLGNSQTTDGQTPALIPSINSGAVAVEAGEMDSFITKSDGTLWAFGDNFYGELGRGPYAVVASDSPVPMVITGTFTGVSCGGSFELALDNSGSVWAWGSGWAVGTGSITDYSTQPVPVTGFGGKKIKSLSAGGAAGLALDSSGMIWGWGDDTYGELGTTNGITQVSGGIDAYSLVPVQAATPQGDSFNAVAGGGYHSLALDTNGVAWAWGDNSGGETGNNTAGTNPTVTPTKVTMPSQTTFNAISAGTAHCVALDSNGNAWAWGVNTYGELGNGQSSTQSDVPIAVSMPSGTKFAAISAGNHYTLALDKQGQVWAWGENQDGQLGDGGTLNHSSPELIGIPIPAYSSIIAIQASGDHSLAVDSNGNVWAWGNNAAGELGDGTASAAIQMSAVQVATLSGISEVTSDAGYNLALKADGTIEAWSGLPLLTYGLGGGNGTNPSNPYTTPVSVPGFNLMATNAVVTAAITSPSSNSVVNVGQSISLTGTYTKSGGTIAKVQYYIDGSSISSSTTSPYTGTWTPSTWGRFTLSAIATDNLGNTSLAATPVTITVTDNDSSGNGLPIWWELQYFGKTGLQNVSTTLASNGSGLTILQCYQQGIDPISYYQGTVPEIFIIRGNGQTGSLGTFLPQPLEVKICNSDGIAEANAPVTFTVSSGGGGISLSSSGTTQHAISTNTDASGQAEVYFEYPTTANGADQISVSAGTATPVIFTEAAPVSGPTVSLAVTPAGATAPAALTLTATVSPSPLSVAFYEGQNLLGTVTTSPFTLNLTNVGAGAHTYTAIATNSSKVTGQGSATYTVNVPVDPLANYKFTRGGIALTNTNQAAVAASQSSAGQTFLSSLIAVGFEQGLRIDDNDQAQFTSGTLPWFMNLDDAETTGYHITESSGTVGYTLAYTNPVVAFGQSTGNAPLYTNQNYSFGLAAGGQIFTQLHNNISEFVLEIYNKNASYTDGSGKQIPLATVVIGLPVPGTAQWTAFANSGYLVDLHITGTSYTTTTNNGVQVLGVTPNWGVLGEIGENVDFDTEFQFTPSTSSEAQWNQPVVPDYSNWALIISHKSAASDFEFKMNYLGSTVSGGSLYPMATTVPSNPESSIDYNLSYTLDFNDRAPWTSTFLSQPQFTGQPLPPQYAGTSIQELLNVSSPVNYQFPAPSGSTYTAIDGSPELHDHPVLDKFVSDMTATSGGNTTATAVAVTNYILNNIHLCDAVSYNDYGSVNEDSINEGGVQRSAEGTFLEGEGNPAEQCALEIFCLRKLGIQCGYVFPPHNSMMMLNSRMSALLRMQLNGAVDPSGDNNLVPQLIPVNWPWVAAYIGGQWVHIFPWMKDTSITQGENLTDYLPQGYQTGLQWLQAYLNRDTSLLPAGTTWSTVEKDDPGYLYPLWLQSQLANSGLSTNDVGVQCVDRQNNYPSFAAMPQPWSVTTTGFSSSNLITSMSLLPADSAGIPKIFDTIELIAYSDQASEEAAHNPNGTAAGWPQWISPEPKLDSGELPILDLHTRRFMVQELQTGNNTHSMQMSLEALRPGTTTVGTFASSDPLINKQLISTGLTSADDNLRFRVIVNRHRTLPASFFTTNSPENPLGPATSPTGIDPWSTFMGVSDDEQIVNERPFRKGDCITLCLDFGTVTQAMLNVQAQEFWTAQQQDLISGSTMDLDTANGTPLYLMGLSYYNQVSNFREQVEAWQEQNTVSFFAFGLSKMSPQRNADGTLPTATSGTYKNDVGAVNLAYPNVDMLFQRMATAFNGTLRPDDGLPESTVVNDWLYILIGECSAQEHTIINSFYNLKDTASTVNLLHDAQTQGHSMILLTDSNYTKYEDTASPQITFTDPNTSASPRKTQTLQDWAGPSMWSQMIAALTPVSGTGTSTTGNPASDFGLTYVTPGPIICASNAYEGMGAMVLNPGNLAAALISGNQLNAPINGGYGSDIFGDDDPTESYTPVVADDSTLTVSDFGQPSLDVTAPTPAAPIVVDQGTSSFQDSTTVTDLMLTSPTLVLDPGTVGSISQATQESGGTAPTSAATEATDLVTQQNSGAAGPTSWFDQSLQQIAEPVDSITGAFYIDSPDLVVPGPMPIAFRRNYNSLNEASNEFGYGWKLDYFAYLVPGTASDGTSLLYAAEQDGSVIAYSLVSGSSPATYTVLPKYNPQLVNQHGDATGSIFNPFNNKITRSGTEPSATYTLTGADGSVRVFKDDSFPLPFAPGTATADKITRERPYLQTWTDTQGNVLTFTFGGDNTTAKSAYGIVSASAENDYGFLNRISSSNGNFVQMDYDTSGHIITANTGDGRSLSYQYDSYGDLIQVTMPDASTVSYTYQHLTAMSATKGTAYSYQVPNTGLSNFTAIGLPAGLTIGSSGLISGTPTAAGTSAVVTTATNSSGTPITTRLGIIVYASAPTGAQNPLYSTHLITQETKPEGRILTNVYDGLGRVTQQQATVGTNNALTTNATITYSTSTPNANGTWTGSTTIKDANQQNTVYAYTSSNITQITDQLGQTIVQTWTTAGSSGYPSLYTRKDKTGLTQTFSYDGNGNLTEVQSTGNLTGTGGTQNSYKYLTNYTAQNLPGKVTEVNGNYEVYTYGTGAAGSGTVPSVYQVTKVQSYAASGALMNEIDNTYSTAGSLGTAPYAAGVITQTSTGIPGSADLSTVTYTFGSNGFPTSESDATSTNDPAVNYTLTYNLRGQLIEKLNTAGGQYTTFTYDALGNKTGEEYYGNGAAIGWNFYYYNSNGQIEWTEGSRYNPTDYTTTLYDGDGRVQQHLVWQSAANTGGSGVTEGGVATTTYTHNAFGDLTQIMDPNGNTTTMGYDYLGQMTSRDISGTGVSTTESWNISHDGGKTVVYTNQLSATTTYKYTDAGKIEEQDNPDSSKLFWTYNTDGRVATQTLANGAVWSYTYNDASRQVVRTLTDGGSTLMTDSQTTDSRGNVIQKVDGDGFVTNSVYDGLNRLKAVTGPPASTNSAQQQKAYTYDAAGFTTTMTDALGDTTVTTFDALQRPTLITISNSSGQSVRSKSYTYSPDHQAITTSDGTNTNSTTTYTDFAGKPLVVQQADHTYTLNVYDANENLTSATDQLGRTTSYQYDGLNRVTQQTLPDGGVIGLTYDNAGDLLSRSMPGNLAWSATYNNASQKQSEKLTQNSNITRSIGPITYYTTNGSGEAAGQIDQVTDGRGIVTTDSYDGFGRLSQSAAVDSSHQLGVTTNWHYNNRGLATEIDQSYQNPALSPPTTVKRTFDGYGAIATEQTYLNGKLKDNWQAAHDAMGHRTSLTELDFPSTPFSYSWRPDGLLAETDFNGSAYQYSYGTNGLLTLRSTPTHIQNILSRDPVGRITEETQTVNGSTILDEKNVSWRGDSTQNGYTADRTGTGAWNENRAYTYDSRGHVTSESFAPSSSTTAALTYVFDNNNAGGLGQRTSATLSGSLSGNETSSYGADAQLASFTTAGTITGPLGTPINQTFDGMGNLLTHNPSTNTDTLTWDALGRLISDQRTASSGSFAWSAVYDGLGRRLQTTSTPSGGTALTLQQSYDPDVEFMELAVTVVGGSRDWLIHGPDINGAYGGLQGTGGIDAVFNGTSGVTTGIISDLYGHTEATVTGGTTVNWNLVRSSGYGAQPGTSASPTDATHDLSTVLAWHGHYIDPTGFYYLGARYYDPQSGVFVSCDPLGHAATMDLYSAFAGDPINSFDPDGRYGTQLGNYFDPTSNQYFGYVGQSPDQVAAFQQQYAQQEVQGWAEQQAQQNFIDSLSPSQLAAYQTSNVIQGVIPGVGFGYQGVLQFDEGNYGNAAGDAGLMVASDALFLFGAKMGGPTGDVPPTIQDFNAYHQSIVNDLGGQLTDQGYEVYSTGSGAPSSARFYNGTDDTPAYTQADLLALRPDGTPVVFEVKTGGADLTGPQTSIYPQIESGEAVPAPRVADFLDINPGEPVSSMYPNGIQVFRASAPGLPAPSASLSAPVLSLALPSAAVVNSVQPSNSTQQP